MLEDLKERVCAANLELVRRGVVIYTWGNVSEIDRKNEIVAIKPSGVSYEHMTAQDIVLVNLSDGSVAEGSLRPSSDTPTHLELYRAFPEIGGVCHTHSVSAVAFAQAGIDVPALGTTHADYFYGPIPCTRALSEDEVLRDYESNSGRVIAGCLRERDIAPLEVPGVLIRNHGPFTWGVNAEEAVYHAVVLETVAEMAVKTLLLNKDAILEDYVLRKHYTRKHGKNAYYGQNRP